MPEQFPPPLSLALTVLRTTSGWSKKRLACALGHSDVTLLSRYESGQEPLTREILDSLVAPLGPSPEAVDLLLELSESVAPEREVKDLSPLALTLQERLRIRIISLGVGYLMGEEVRRVLLHRWGRIRIVTERLTALVDETEESDDG